MDTTAHVWTIPALRMKATREHRGSLCAHPAAELGDGGGPLVFTGNLGEPLDEKVLRRLLERQRALAVPHGLPVIIPGGPAEVLSTGARSSRRRWPTPSATRSRRRENKRGAVAPLGDSALLAGTASACFTRRLLRHRQQTPD